MLCVEIPRWQPLNRNYRSQPVDGIGTNFQRLPQVFGVQQLNGSSLNALLGLFRTSSFGGRHFGFQTSGLVAQHLDYWPQYTIMGSEGVVSSPNGVRAKPRLPIKRILVKFKVQSVHSKAY
jgi:hypothetical protein